MALKDRTAFGMSLPHRSPDTIDMPAVRQVAQRADALGFRDLWVTENTLDHVFCFDPMVILTYAAAVTTQIRLGVGLGRDHHYAQFQTPRERRVRRIREGVELIKALWTEPRVNYQGSIFQLDGGTMAPKPIQKPHPPIWLGGGHPDAIRRAATIADGWMGSGGSSTAEFSRSVPALRAALEKVSRDPATFPISKRVFLSVHDRPDVARAELDRWFTTVYHNPNGADASGVHGTPEQVRKRLQQLVAMGANHLLLNPVCRHVEQLEALAAIVGLS